MPNARKLPSGSWRVQLYVGKKDGKRVYKSFTGPDKRTAEKLAAEYAMDPQEAPSRDSVKTLQQALDAYINSKAAVLSPVTLRGYKSIAKNHLSSISGIRLDRLTIEMLQAAINTEATSVGSKTVRNISGLLTSVLRMFRPELDVKLTLPAKTRLDIRVPTRDEITQIYAAVKGSPMELPFLLASQCGLRLSEICALTPADIGDGVIRINKALVPGEDGMHLKPPKSYAGYRDVVCDKSLTDLIRARCTGDHITELTHSEISHRWPHVLHGLNIPHVRFHDLRHYYASVGLLLGVPPRYMAELMGHSSTDMIDRVYQHTFPDSKRQFAASLSAQTAALLSSEP